MEIASDNAAVVACEGVLAHLDREGCKDIERLASKDFWYLSYTELEENIWKVQSIKAVFFGGFGWPRGRKRYAHLQLHSLKRCVLGLCLVVWFRILRLR
jgi:hypothetical protein